MEGKYHILGITTEGKRNYWTGSGWSEVLTASKIFTDLDDARDEWWKVTGNGKKLPEGFRRIIVPNYPEETGSAKESMWNDSQYDDAEDKEFAEGEVKKYFEDVSRGYGYVTAEKAVDDLQGQGIMVDTQDLVEFAKENKIKSVDLGELVFLTASAPSIDEIKKDLGENSATEIAVKNPDVSANFDMKSLVNEFQKYLSNQNRYDEVWYSGKPDSFTVDVDGDWKHDHLYMDMLVEEFLNDKGLTLADVQSRTTEEDGSDWYRAERTYRIKVPKTGELTAGQIAKKINNDKKAEESVKGQASSNFSRKSVYESIIGRR